MKRDFTVIARSLHSGAAKANAKIELISAGNRVLGTGTTDEFGVAKFERRLTQGTLSNALVAIMAQRGDPVQHLDDFARSWLSAVSAWICLASTSMAER